jgi:shikimate dehydrogenase
MRLFGLIGFPLTHSFSKRYFTEKFEREDLTDCRYELFPIETIQQLPALLTLHPELIGLNVTVPYKRKVIEFLNNKTELPAGLDACNCIRIQDAKLSGYNTDHTAFEKSLKPLLSNDPQHALILGNGGAAAAVRYVLEKLNISYDLVSREKHVDSTLTYKDLDRNILEKSKLIINTTPLGMYPHVDDRPPIPYHYVTSKHVLFDLVYNPEKTLFLQKGEELGAIIKNGEEMLVLQAEESWRIWNQ